MNEPKSSIYEFAEFHVDAAKRLLKRRNGETIPLTPKVFDIRWEHDWVNVSTVCAGDYVGLEEIDDGVWNVYFGPLKLGRFLERHRRIEDAYGRLLRSQ